MSIKWETLKTKEDLEQEALALASNAARAKRDSLLNTLSKDIERHHSQSRLGVETTHTIENLDNYAQLLRDIPTQEGFPFNIVWPQL